MKKNTIILLTIVVLLIIGGLAYYYSGNNGSEGNTNTQPNENQIVPAQVQNNPDGSKAYTIEMTSSGFAPNNLEINKGDSVTWATKDSGSYWPASAMHPTHTVYPGSDIKKCGTSDEESIFDACKALGEGESFTFTFNEEGSWGYHDHVNSGKFGKIIVK